MLEFDGLQVFVDPVSARYLAGTEIDYVLGTTGAGLQVQQPQGRRHLRLRLVVRRLATSGGRPGAGPAFVTG